LPAVFPGIAFAVPAEPECRPISNLVLIVIGQPDEGLNRLRISPPRESESYTKSNVRIIVSNQFDESTRSSRLLGQMPKGDCGRSENSRVGVAAQQVDRCAQTFLRKGTLRHAQLPEDVCCASTNARIIRNRELKGFVEHLATAEPM